MMKMNNICSLEYDSKNPFNKPSILKLSNKTEAKKIFTLKDTLLFDELSLINNNLIATNLDSDVEIVTLSEPEKSNLTEFELLNFLDNYKQTILNARQYQLKLVHIISNTKWYSFVQDLIQQYSIPVYLTESELKEVQELFGEENFYIIDEFLYLKDFQVYSNDINNNLLIDLTHFSDSNSYYNKTLDSILLMASNFDRVTILITKDSYFPLINKSNINIVTNDNVDNTIIDTHSYVYVFNNQPYNHSIVNKIMYYSANSKIVFTNYNFKLNNFLPSVILNLSTSLNYIKPLEYENAFDILNENRNSILYNFTFINVLHKIFGDILNKRFIAPHSLSNTLDNYTSNIYLTNNSINQNIETNLRSYKYDVENTLAFPIIFLDERYVEYEDSYMLNTDGYQRILNISENKKKLQEASRLTTKKLSVIVPIHNNGRYLKYKCFRSLKSLTCFESLEIIFIDDGSSDFETLRIVEDIRQSEEIVYHRFDRGSGSASKPRNKGIELATTNLITYLDPDNETIDDGHSVLLNEIINNPELDMVVGDIVREDNKKRNSIRYSNKVKNALGSDVISDTREALINTRLTVQSIQGLIVNKKIITENDIKMVEGAAGQDTLFYQELFLDCKNVKVISHMIHSYYAYVEGSVTNTVSSSFFEKFYKVEKERIKFLTDQDLIENYMEIKFNFYFKNWYFKKYSQVTMEEREASFLFLKKIFMMYVEYKNLIDIDIIEFFKNEENHLNA